MYGPLQVIDRELHVGCSRDFDRHGCTSIGRSPAPTAGSASQGSAGSSIWRNRARLRLTGREFAGEDTRQG
jgi:hypothetical protein